MFFPLRLQFFSDPDTGSNGQGSNGDGQQNQQSQQSQQATSFDYDKLASIINGKQTVTEDTILKNYFKQQGLSQEEAAQAIQTFKTEKAKNQPDVTVIQTQLAQAQALADKAEIERLATVEAIGLGIDVKTLPYVLKMADLNSVKGQDGKVDQESIKKALSKVLEDIPQLKPSKENSNGGFQIGGTGGQGNTNANEDALRGIFGIKK
jgi:hypothetical protein